MGSLLIAFRSLLTSKSPPTPLCQRGEYRRALGSLFPPLKKGGPTTARTQEVEQRKEQLPRGDLEVSGDLRIHECLTC